MFNKLAILLFAAFFMAACENNSDTESAQMDDMTQEENDMASEDGNAGMQGQDMPQPLSSDEISDDELKSFAEAAQEVQMINQSIQQEMVSSVERGGLTVERFTEMQQASMSGQDMEASADEMKKFDATMKSLEGIQMEAQKAMQDKLANHGISEKKVPGDRYECSG
jgi:hypothetical protein